ncbi:MAG: hypothetical protein OXI91_00750 [Chloroflexota bacterium]|nr:hypothetical protein [Chloroflexota bacterium]
MLVEGRDEQEFFRELLRFLAIDDIQIHAYDGKDNLGNFINNFVDVVGFDSVESIGVVQDADESAQSALQSVRSRLRNAKLPVPLTYLQPAGETIKVQIFVMPDNESNGALENLCLAALAEDTAMECVNEFMECLSGKGILPPENRLAKARMNSFLASRDEPDTRLGIAAAKGYIPWTNAAFTDLTQFLKDL